MKIKKKSNNNNNKKKKTKIYLQEKTIFPKNKISLQQNKTKKLIYKTTLTKHPTLNLLIKSALMKTLTLI